MKPKKRQKLCQNCEGDVDLDVIVCPYCAADLRDEKPEKGRMAYVTAQRQEPSGPTFDSLYPSPHAAKSPPPQETPVQAAATVVVEEEQTKGTLIPTFLLTLGIQLLLLGILTALFSHQGFVVLKWSARFWFVYLFAAIPLLVFGYKKLSLEN